MCAWAADADRALCKRHAPLLVQSVAPTSQHPPITPNRSAIARAPFRPRRQGRFACIRFLAATCASHLLVPIASLRVSASMRLASQSVTGPSLGVAKMEDRKRPAMTDRDDTAPPAKRQATLSNGTKALADLDPLADRDRVFEVRQHPSRALLPPLKIHH